MGKSIKQVCFLCMCKLNTVDTIVGKCRCNNVFCIKHRLKHSCTFDYIDDYKENNKLVKITPVRIETI